MKKLIAIVLAVTLLATLSGVALAGKGNDLPSGRHYNLNLIAKDKEMPQEECDSGNRIFVKLDRGDRVKTKINLQAGDFGVIDCDGTDGEATFQLPNPDPDNTGTTVYSVYLRLRGKPNGDIIMTTCGEYILEDNEVYCSVLQVVESRETGHGKNKFNNVSAELLYIYAWVCQDPPDCTTYKFVRVPLFADDWEGFFWDYDNNGVRIAQLRFYEGVHTRVPDPLKSIDPDEGEQCEDYPAVRITADNGVNLSGVTPADVDFGDDITVTDVTPVVGKLNMIDVDISIGEAETGPRIVRVFCEECETDGVTYIIPFEVLTGTCP